MFNPFNLPAPEWRAPVPAPDAARRVAGASWLCSCPICTGAAPLPDVEVLDAAELFARHPLAHLELG
ncbi:MAG TPA: hypothetical protein VD931_09725 [Baekduia sp.]|nr:hypothetical protein [Baekduia sp.]